MYHSALSSNLGCKCNFDYYPSIRNGMDLTMAYLMPGEPWVNSTPLRLGKNDTIMITFYNNGTQIVAYTIVDTAIQQKEAEKEREGEWVYDPRQRKNINKPYRSDYEGMIVGQIRPGEHGNYRITIPGTSMYHIHLACSSEANDCEDAFVQMGKV